MVRLSADLFAKATQLAQAEDRPLSYFIRRAVKQDVEMRWRDGEWPTDSSLDFDETTPASAESNTGHGWVRPRPDGYKARCGGPAICSECALEAASFKKGGK
jgi:hypothetical protein